MILKFSGFIPEEDLIGRVMGPDTLGGFTYVRAVLHSPADHPGNTVCMMHPLPPDETRIARDVWGQVRVTF